MVPPSWFLSFVHWGHQSGFSALKPVVIFLAFGVAAFGFTHHSEVATVRTTTITPWDVSYESGDHAGFSSTEPSGGVSTTFPGTRDPFGSNRTTLSTPFWVYAIRSPSGDQFGSVPPSRVTGNIGGMAVDPSGTFPPTDTAQTCEPNV